jgi:hypothetical protein
MQTILRIATTEIIPCPELSHYNFLVYKFRTANSYGVTHLVEIYDDLNGDPDFDLGSYRDHKFNGKMRGIGDPIPQDKFSCGGVYFNVELYVNPYIKDDGSHNG